MTFWLFCNHILYAMLFASSYIRRHTAEGFQLVTPSSCECILHIWYSSCHVLVFGLFGDRFQSEKCLLLLLLLVR